jgi:hypothetical protein
MNYLKIKDSGNAKVNNGFILIKKLESEFLDE